MPRPSVSVAVAEAAGHHTYYATLGPYARGRGRTNIAADKYGHERMSAACVLRSARVSTDGGGGGGGGGGVRSDL